MSAAVIWCWILSVVLAFVLGSLLTYDDGINKGLKIAGLKTDEDED